MSTRILYRYLHLFPNHKRLVYEAKKHLIRAHIKKLQYNFLKRCEEEVVIPKSMRIAEEMEEDHTHIELQILRIHKNQASKEVIRAFNKSAEIRNKINTRIEPSWKNQIISWMYNGLRYHRKKYEMKLQSKLQRLISTSKWNNTGRENNYLNLSKKVLNENQKCILKLGMKFHLNRPVNFLDVARQLEKVKGKLTEDSFHLAKGAILYKYVNQNNSHNHIPKRLRMATADLKKDKEIKITKADKAKVIILMDKDEYKEKMYQLLNDETTYKKLKKDPTEEVNKEFHKELRNIFGKDTASIQRFTTRSAKLSYLYGVVKTHKPGNPMRPVISTINSVNSKLSDFMAKELSKYVGTISNSHIVNNVSFIEDVSKFKIKRNHRFTSFDVSSLFTSVPIEVVLDFLKEYLTNFDTPYETNKMIKLIKICLVGTCFEFEGCFFKQLQGMQMGAKLSPIAANFYMEIFETKMARNIISKALYWRRYVDDVMSIWTEDTNLDQVLEELNSICQKIKFTKESESNNRISFLDILIVRHNDKLEFTIYRKPTDNHLMIDKFSKHRSDIKELGLISMFLRALRIVSPQYMEEERNKIYEIGRTNGYNSIEITSSEGKAKNIFYRTEKRKRDYEQEVILSLPYNESFIDLKYFLKQLGITLVFSYSNTIGKTLIKNSPENEKGIVYKIKCECGKFYIGQTSLQMEKRMKQHKQSIIRDDEKNGINVHLRTCNGEIKWNEGEILHKSKLFFDRNYVEAVVIKDTWNENVNMNKGLYIIDNISQNIVKRIILSKDYG